LNCNTANSTVKFIEKLAGAKKNERHVKGDLPSTRTLTPLQLWGNITCETSD